MISNLLLVLGAAVLSAALRSFQHRLLFRLGTLGIGITSFLVGWLLVGNIWVGLALAASWLFLPWLEILTRVRRLRLPIERTLHHRTPPNRSTFPGFSEMTDEIEILGFEHMEDIGWNYEGSRQFYRVLNADQRKTQACICLAEQEDLAFYYITLTSRAIDGRVFMTWNYPFSYGLKLPPRLKVCRFSSAGPFSELLALHEKFLTSEGIATDALLTQTPEEIVHTMQNEMRAQITHNLDLGLLERDGEKLIRYTLRGMFFLWMQFLRDLVRIS
jgi:hypothetical protein